MDDMDDMDENLRIRYGYHIESCESLGTQPLDYDTWVEQTLEDDYYHLLCCQWNEQTAEENEE